MERILKLILSYINNWVERFLSFPGKYCTKLKDAALVFSRLWLSDKGPLV